MLTQWRYFHELDEIDAMATILMNRMVDHVERQSFMLRPRWDDGLTRSASMRVASLDVYEVDTTFTFPKPKKGKARIIPIQTTGGTIWAKTQGFLLRIKEAIGSFIRK